jgi:glycosyltransferase involved in cell wall biosynthesis
MRVLALTNLYPNPFQPHLAPFNRHKLRRLGERHPVRVVSPIAWTDELAARRRGVAPLPPGRRVTFDGLSVDHPRYFFTPRVARDWYGHFYLTSARRTLQRVAAEFRPDIIFAPWAYPDGWAAVRFARGLAVPAVVQVLGSDVLLLDQFPGRKRRTLEALRSADGVVAVSEDLARHLVANGVQRDRIRVIYDAADPTVFYPGRREEASQRVGVARCDPVVLFIGNLVPVKAVDVLIDAVARLADERFPVSLIVIGQGPLRSALEKQAAERGVGGRVHFTGAMPQSELPDWYRAADVFVLPSRSEGVPNVLLEATACGTPWVASRVGGIPEIAHPESSRLVPPNSPADLARAIRESLALRIGSASPCNVRSPETAVDELEQFLAQIAAIKADAPQTDAAGAPR